MTVGLVIRVPGHGAVLACDSRLSDDGAGTIYSDTERKWGQFGQVIACYAGSPGGLWLELLADPPKRWAEFHKRTTVAGGDFEILAYDRARDRLVHTDEKGWAVPVHGLHAAIGCGGPIALGVLDAAKTPSSLEAAAQLAGRAIKIACRRNVFCGGRVRVVLVKGRRAPLETR